MTSRNTDPDLGWRQLAVIAADGKGAVFNGAKITSIVKAKVGRNCAAAGNILRTTDVVDAMVSTFEANEDQSLPERLHARHRGRAGRRRRTEAAEVRSALRRAPGKFCRSSTCASISVPTPRRVALSVGTLRAFGGHLRCPRRRAGQGARGRKRRCRILPSSRPMKSPTPCAGAPSRRSRPSRLPWRRWRPPSRGSMPSPRRRRSRRVADARALEQSLARGGAAGPLAGVPVAIKDLLFTKGLRTTFGSRLYADFVPEDDDIVVERLKAAGAIVIGKTNVAEFGYGAVGHNPLLPDDLQSLEPRADARRIERGLGRRRRRRRLPAGRRQRRRRLGPPARGLHRPVRHQGVDGPRAGVAGLPRSRLPGASGWELIEHIGPMARSVADAALMLQVMAGPDARDRWSLPTDGSDWRDAARPVDRLRPADRLLPAMGGRACRSRGARAGRSPPSPSSRRWAVRSRRSTRRCAGWWRPVAPSSRSKATSRACASWRPGARPNCPAPVRGAVVDELAVGAIHRCVDRAQARRSRRCAASWNATISC